MSAIVRGVLPFIVADIARVLLIASIPALRLWLPTLLFRTSAG